jgi:hypothetical protein
MCRRRVEPREAHLRHRPDPRAAMLKLLNELAQDYVDFVGVQIGDRETGIRSRVAVGTAEDVKPNADSHVVTSPMRTAPAGAGAGVSRMIETLRIRKHRRQVPPYSPVVVRVELV